MRVLFELTLKQKRNETKKKLSYENGLTFLSKQKVQEHQESFPENTLKQPNQNYRYVTSEENELFEVTSFFFF